MRTLGVRAIVIGDGGVRHREHRPGYHPMYSVEFCDMGQDQQHDWCQQCGYALTQSVITDREMSIPNRSYISDRR